MIVYLYVILSFLLDGFISNYTNYVINDLSYFNTIYTIISLLVVFNYFYNKKKYLFLILFLGLLFDIVYTGTFLLNVVLFFLVALIISFFNDEMYENIITINLKCIFGIVLYHALSYLILYIFNFNSYDIYLLGEIIIRSIIMTIIYTSISYLLFKKININSIK